MKLNNEENKLKMSLQLLASDNIDDDNDNEDNGDEGQEEQEKTFTQEDINKMIAKAKKKEREKAEAEFNKRFEEKIAEEKRLAGLSDEQKQKEAEKKAREAFIKEQAEFKREKMLYETEKLLRKEGLNEELAGYVIRESAEETLEEINKLKGIFNASIEQEINSKLKNTAPRKGQAPADIDPFLQGFSK